MNYRSLRKPNPTSHYPGTHLSVHSNELLPPTRENLIPTKVTQFGPTGKKARYIVNITLGQGS